MGILKVKSRFLLADNRLYRWVLTGDVLPKISEKPSKLCAGFP